MPNPSPIYVVEYNSQALPGYVQNDERRLGFRQIVDTYYGASGGTIKRAGADMRRIPLSFRVLSRLGGATELQHLDDCMAQYREALAIVARSSGLKTLRIHDADRYYLAEVEEITAPLVAGESRRITYNVSFIALPWAYSTSPVTSSFSGNGTVNLTLPDTRETYPVYSVPSGVTAFTAVDDSGRSVEFTRGTVTGTITIDAATLSVTKSDGSTAISTIGDLNFGQRHAGGAGNYAIVVTGFGGSGTVGVSVTPRYEL